MKSKLSMLVVAGAFAVGFGSTGFAAGDHAGHGAAASSTSAAAMTSGEVRKVDLDQGKVTIKHDPIANLDMPSMTMVFRAQSPDLLKNLQVGDKIRFHAESVNGAITVTHIQK